MWTILPVCFHIPCNTGKFDAVELKTEVVEEGDEAGVVVDGCAVAARVGDQITPNTTNTGRTSRNRWNLISAQPKLY